jgi:ParB family transcriptional regulator, chromosome partitioning protein
MKDEKKARSFYDLLKEHRVDEVQEGEVIIEIDPHQILLNPYQTRKVFEQGKIDELAESIKEHGVFQPIIVKKEQEQYILISGERRLRAVKQLKLNLIPAIVRPYERAKMIEISLAENLQRENLSPIEEAEAYKLVMDHLNITQTELALKVGKSRSHITNMIGLVHLPHKVQDMISTGVLSMGHARALSKLENKEQIEHLAQMIIEKQLNVREIEQMTQNEKKTNQLKRQKTNVFKHEESVLSEYLGYKTKVHKNKIIIHFEADELDFVLRKLLKK